MTIPPTLHLTQELIKRPSLTPDDAGCMDLLAAELRPLGFRCDSLPFADVSNLWAVLGSEGPLFVFAGHTDVVPTGPHEQWTYPPFTPTVEGDFLYGRGAADMKGALAAMVVATRQFLQAHPQPKGRIAFLLTSDEEGKGVHGTRQVMEHLHQNGVKLDYCVVGEPSSDQEFGDTIKHGRRGSLHGHLTILGKQGHIAYPHLADNPIHRALAALQELTSVVWDAGDADFQPTSLQISNLNSGTGASNVIPGQLTCHFNFRFSPAVTADELQKKVEALLERHKLRYDLTWKLSGEAFITRHSKLVTHMVDAVKEVTGLTPRCTTGGGTSDARFIAPYGVEVLEFGPINATIHCINECVRTADLEKLTQVYQGILTRLLA